MSASRAGAIPVALAALCTIAGPSVRAAPSSSWLREHATMEWMAGTGGWRCSLGLDNRVPGFSALAGGGEVTFGFDITTGVGLVASGRVLAAGFGKDHYLEGLGSFGPQLQVSERVRLRGGVAAGQLILGDDRAILVGGFLVGSFDLFTLGAGRLAVALAARLDLDGHINAAGALPGQSLGLALGLGIRY
jgi:hypothetical protein